MPTDYKLYFKTLISNIIYIEKYVRGTKYPNMLHESRKNWTQFIAESELEGKKCMQVGVRKAKYGKNWAAVDKYDNSPLVDYKYDLHSLQFKDETFDCIACKAVLEHVEEPHKAIDEMYRVLKKGGKIWVEIPFNQPYHPSPGDYWRVTPDGIRIWMKQFNEIASGGYFDKSVLYTGVYFWGQK